MTKKLVIDIETTDLDPKLGRIICIGCLDTNESNPVIFQDEDEVSMLNDFLSYYKKGGFNEIIGYNILFDLRFIFARCMKHEIYGNGFFSAKITDLMWTMKSVVKMYSMNRPGKLGEWCSFLFGDGKTALEHSILELYEKGKIDIIVEYNRRDVIITKKLHERIKKVLYGM